MVKWLILILAGYALYRLFANDFNKKQKESKKESAAETERKVAAGELVKDPECGAYVAVDGSISVRDGETVHRFCSVFRKVAGNCPRAKNNFSALRTLCRVSFVVLLCFCELAGALEHLLAC